MHCKCDHSGLCRHEGELSKAFAYVVDYEREREVPSFVERICTHYSEVVERDGGGKGG